MKKTWHLMTSLIHALAVCLIYYSSDLNSVHAQSHLPQSTEASRIHQSVSRTSLSRYAPDQWIRLGVRVENRTDDDHSVLSLVIDEQQQQHFGRELWLPPHSVRTDWLPFQRGAFATDSSPSISPKTLLLDRKQASGSDALLRNNSELIYGDLLLPMTDPGSSLGIIADTGDDSAINSVLALRLSRGLSRQVVVLDDTFYTAGEAALSGLQQLVLMSDRVSKNASSAESVVGDWLRKVAESVK